MKILTFGDCCAKSKQNHLNAVEAAKKSGITDEVVNIGEWEKMADLGVMASPSIMIDGKLVSSGKLSSVTDIIGYIEKARKA